VPLLTLPRKLFFRVKPIKQLQQVAMSCVAFRLLCAFFLAILLYLSFHLKTFFFQFRCFIWSGIVRLVWLSLVCPSLNVIPCPTSHDAPINTSRITTNEYLRAVIANAWERNCCYTRRIS
jgi:hypothetical protein